MPGPAFLRGDRVELRTFEEEDIGMLAPVYADPEVRRRMDVHTPHTERLEREWFESLDETNHQFVVCRPGEPEDPLGQVTLFDLDTDAGTAELGAVLLPDARGQGYAVPACSLLLTYAFDERRLHRVRANTLAVNDPAQATLEGLGFTREGRTREAAIGAGERVDELRYGLLATEWRERNTTAER